MINISFDKKKLPHYLFKFNVVLTAFFALWLTVGVGVMVTVGIIYDESVITYAVMGSVFALFFIVFAIALIVNNKLQKRLIEERTAEIEERFADIPLEMAKENLIKEGIITESGFVYKDEVFGEAVLPFEKAAFAFGFNVVSTVIVLEIAIGSIEDNEVKAVHNLNGNLYNFLINSNFDLSGNRVFDLLINNKKTFTEALLNGGKKLNKLLLQ